ncbi:MAG TPA: RNA polymerase sigma-54 factor [Spirochaetes bacterium]|nr:RNA polymerase sigma-54 factor [Spirochaetota bacterium]
MEIRQEIQLKQIQKLIMTPQLQQAIKMLQLSNIELNEKIEEELMDNPALEMDEKNSDYETNLDKDLILKKLSSEEKDTAYEDGLYDEYFFSDRSFTRSDRNIGEDKKREFIEGAISREETLHEYLLWQLRLVKIPHEDFNIGEILLSYIDSKGYLPVPLNVISDELNIPLEKLEELLVIIHSLDPPGVGARDIKECLLLQLKYRGSYPLAEKIINEYLNEIKLKKYDKIAKKLKVSVNMVKEAFNILSKLEPYPGRQFYSNEVKYIIPEVSVEERDGKLEVIPNNYSIPKLKVNSYFEKLLRKNSGDKRIKNFALDKIQRAKSFIHSIEQRESTLVRVMKKILDEQKGFFEKGPKYLKPLTLKDVSVHLDLHESTISRITSSKYVQTSFGVFQLKFFFSNPIPSKGDRDYSSTSIKEMLKDIIQSEGTTKHLSDQKIANLFAKRGIEIARRTVAKYRKGLKILPSNLRG